MKAKNPKAFASSFQALGIDVDKKGLAVVDPDTGKVLHGSEAVKKVIEDKRLTAVFQEAGRKSLEFQKAQARIAYKIYYVPDKRMSFSLKVGKKNFTIKGRYRDILKSLAGKAAAVDRAVQYGVSGFKRKFRKACQSVVKKYNIEDPTSEKLAGHEKDIIEMIKNRPKVLKMIEKETQQGS